jgi:hypothetical protein
MVATGWNAPPMQDRDLAYGVLGVMRHRHHPSPPVTWPWGAKTSAPSLQPRRAPRAWPWGGLALGHPPAQATQRLGCDLALPPAAKAWPTPLAKPWVLPWLGRGGSWGDARHRLSPCKPRLGPDIAPITPWVNFFLIFF